MDHVAIGNFGECAHLVVKRALLILAGQILADVVFTDSEDSATNEPRICYSFLRGPP